MLITVEKYAAQIREIEQFVGVNFNQPTIENYLNERFNGTKVSIKAAFKKVHGKSITKYHNEYRLNTARELLLAGAPCKKVAKDVGYSSLPAFCLAFKNRFGCSPGAVTKGDNSNQSPPLNYIEELIKIEDYIKSHPKERLFTQYFFQFYKSNFPSIRYYFKRKHKKTIDQYSNSYKAEIAEKMLMSGSNTLEVASAIGLSPSYLTQLLAKKKGVTPAEINKQIGKTTRKHLAIIEEVKTYIAQHIDSQLSATRISETLHHFKKTVKNLFLQYEGLDVTRYIDQRRIERAKELLMKGYSLKEVSAIMNYSHSSALNAFFKAKTGLTPMDFAELEKSTAVDTNTIFYTSKVNLINSIQTQKVIDVLALVDEYVIKQADKIKDDRDVARYFNVDVDILRRRYLEYRGKYLKETISVTRIERVKELLLEGKSVRLIYQLMNFETPVQLTAFFRKCVKMSPTAFQKISIGKRIRHLKSIDTHSAMLAELELLIRSNLELNNTIKALAQKYNMGTSNVRYHFLKSRGFSVGDFLTRCKLENAINLMLKQVPILKAIKSSAFKTIDEFYKAYVSRYGEHGLYSIFRLPS